MTFNPILYNPLYLKVYLCALFSSASKFVSVCLWICLYFAVPVVLILNPPWGIALQPYLSYVALSVLLNIAKFSLYLLHQLEALGRHRCAAIATKVILFKAAFLVLSTSISSSSWRMLSVLVYIFCHVTLPHCPASSPVNYYIFNFSFP